MRKMRNMLIVALMYLTVATAMGQTTYHVVESGEDDGNDGLSSATALATIPADPSTGFDMFKSDMPFPEAIRNATLPTV